ncbi:MAG: flagellar motor protein [Desulfobacteraceae bacterium]|nr:flagellar motor protein [Desulfobacteraceae bacterium]
MNLTSIIGLGLGILAVFGGALLEGIHLHSILQGTAAIIVLGGTFGATLLSFPFKIIVSACKSMKKAMIDRQNDLNHLIQSITRYAIISRREGRFALQDRLPEVADHFLRRALTLVVDGTDTKTMREVMEVELNQIEANGDLEAKVFEAAGGYAPTIGIIGAVLGLIHVMQNLTDPSQLGTGIAVAFVATVYGVGSANLIFFPFASKLRNRLKQTITAKEMMLEGAIGIQEGTNPHIIEEKLKSFLTVNERNQRKVIGPDFSGRILDLKRSGGRRQ